MPDLAALSSHEVDLDLDLEHDLGPPALPRRFFSRPAEVVAPELIGCLLVRRQPSGALLWGVIVETEAYTQDDPACHGHRRRSASNETLFGPPGNFYVYRCYGIHHCVNVVTDRAEWASGVLLRAAALPAAPERQASGPGLLARCFGIEQHHDGQGACGEGPLWLAPRPSPLQALLSPAPTAPSADAPLRQDRRIVISAAVDQPWRWDLGPSRSVIRRARGDRQPAAAAAWRPEHLDWGARGYGLGAGTI
ncbi:MAG: DNA-3-methyladenine glycosylase, partial [Cyanobacteriota bacterium]